MELTKENRLLDGVSSTVWVEFKVGSFVWPNITFVMDL
jgi:hypothetical protein